MRAYFETEDGETIPLPEPMSPEQTDAGIMTPETFDRMIRVAKSAL